MDEYFDWVDRNDRIIGVASRSEAHRLMLFHRAVHVYAWGKSGGLILQKRSLSKDLEPGKWTVSCSGHVDRGETYLHAAVREMKEELGLSLQDTDLCELLQSDPSPQNGHEFVRSYGVRREVCPIHDAIEVSEVREISLSDLDEWMNVEPKAFASSFLHLFPMVRQKFPFFYIKDI